MPKRNREEDEDETGTELASLLSPQTAGRLGEILGGDLIWPIDRDATGIEIELRKDASLSVARVGRLLGVAGVKDGIFMMRPDAVRIRLVCDYAEDETAKRARVETDRVVDKATKVDDATFEAGMDKDLPSASLMVRRVVTGARKCMSVSRVKLAADKRYVFLFCNELSLVDIDRFHRDNRAPIVSLAVWPGNKLVVRVISDA